MLELTGMGSVLRGLGWLYWLLAAGAIYLAIRKGKSRRAKIAWTLVAIAVFAVLPVKEMIERVKRDAYAREAWAYFKKKCDTESGEKIYKTYTGVKSVLVVKPLPPATEKDLFDQFWYGDPYSNATPASGRGMYVSGNLIRASVLPDGKIQNGYESVEIKHNYTDGPKYQRIAYSTDGRTRIISEIAQPISRFGISWDDISTPEDRNYWVASSRLRVIDLTDESVVAERIGFLIEGGFGSQAGQRRPWLTARGPKTTCPPLAAPDYADQWFVLRVLKSTGEKTNGK